ncbi:PD-(D/E)XK nuclease-like domain-containing protein [Lactiplantibacillus plantarum]|uniref:PD-(D/E)XK nuclease-like domain-containing protein n=1 Tax=Lactiplantibacillus plantarum TaxID=1590 RepID=UPI0021A29968|nr:PD-(D/E)XK nuclease-like domain-containing protein [Lactiplantibacillus plantarum]
MIKNITSKTKVTQEINRSNYYSNRMDWAYMSATLLKNFMQCEAKALHSLKNPVENDALPLLVGNYLHSHFESDEAFESFCNEHKSKLFTRTNTLRADFKKADKMIKRLESDAMFNFFYNSPENEKEVILDGELYGVPWKARIDSLNVKDGYFCDLKTTQDLHKRYWSVERHEWVSFFDQYNYALQMGAYKKLLQQKYHKPFTCYIFAIDKTDSPGLAALEVPFDEMEEQLNVIEEYQPRVLQIERDEVIPARCGVCDYCKQTMQLDGFIKDPQELIS